MRRSPVVSPGPRETTECWERCSVVTRALEPRWIQRRSSPETIHSLRTQSLVPGSMRPFNDPHRNVVVFSASQPNYGKMGFGGHHFVA